jgi:uncharacterized membrane protein YidH (DUF202 family)
MTAAGPPRPPGVAPERTALAWTRTLLSYGVCVLLCLRLARGSPVLLAAVAAGGGLAVAALGGAARGRQRELPAGTGLAPVQAAVAAGLTVLLAVAAAALVLVD